MRLPAVLAADLHLTSSPADEYRWGLLPWLAAECRAEKAQTLLLLGDLTDAKDYHPAQLVNRLVRAVGELRKSVPRIVILMGNHDYLKSGHMFFEFLSSIPGVEVVTRLKEDEDRAELTMFLPHTKSPMTDWRGMDFSHYRYVFMHQTVRGSVSSNGQALDGENLPDLSAAGRVYSGDIHVPQVVNNPIIGRVEYVGSPYHVHFGDAFKPRCVALDHSGRAFDLHYQTISRLALKVTGADELRRIELREGDQVKLTVRLPEAERHEWRGIRDEAASICDAAGVDLRSLEMEVIRTRRRMSGRAARPEQGAHPERVLYEFVAADELGGELLDAGLECLT